jgi:branched-chain amino acid transport system substrate-binding protein
LALAKKYGRDEKAANSHNYINGVQWWHRSLPNASCGPKPKVVEVTKESLYEELLAMNGYQCASIR